MAEVDRKAKGRRCSPFFGGWPLLPAGDRTSAVGEGKAGEFVLLLEIGGFEDAVDDLEATDTD